MANNFYCRTALAGGGSGALDAIDGAGLNDLDFAIISILNNVYIYTLDDDSAAAESSPDVIKPDANAGDKRWILQSLRATKIIVGDGASALPSMTYENDLTTGVWYDLATTSLQFSVGGFTRWRIDVAGNFENVNAGRPALANATASATIANISPSSTDTDTGLGTAGADILSIIAGGVEAIRAAEVAGIITLTFTDKLVISDTTTANLGVIYKGSDRFLHNFHDPTGGGAVPDGLNTFLGVNAGNFTTGSTATQTYHGSRNTGVGVGTLANLTFGFRNSAFGWNALNVVSEGRDNSAFGEQSLLVNTTGNGNTAIGEFALGTNITGDNNIALGTDAGGDDSFFANNESGTNSIFIGNSAYPLNDGETNQIVIGHSVIGLGSNTVVLGDDDIINTYLKGTVNVDSNAADTVAIMKLENTGGAIKVFVSSASPEGVITGDIGDLCVIDTTAGEIYIKESGSGNTGWGEVGGGVASFSSLWYHGVELTTTIGTVSTFTKITSFENVGLEDAGGNLIGDATTDDDITVNLAGTYSIAVTSSFRNASGSNKNMKIVPKIIFATPRTITDATNATPIVITSTAHGFLNGDMITQSGVGGNTAANGDFFVTNKTDDTYELETLANVDVAGNGAYTSGGTVDACYSGEIVIESVVSGSDLERGAAAGRVRLEIGDLVELAVANTSDANNLVLSQIAMDIGRIE